MIARKSVVISEKLEPLLAATRIKTGFLLCSSKRLFASSCVRNHEIPCSMSRWETSRYGSISSLEFNTDAPVPKGIKKDAIMIKVKAASVNPFDIEMIEGYGSKAMNVLRRLYNVKEFPIVTGRDCSGVVVKTGQGVRRFKVGDEVWCAKWVLDKGTHAEYCLASQSEVSLKPKTLSHLEAASIPYVACTSWTALVSRAGIDPKKIDNGKHILLLGGSGGIGTFAIQLAKCFGNTVTATCSQSNINFLYSLGADNVIDYQAENHDYLIQQIGPYDIVLDARSGHHTDIIGCTEKTTFITLMPPFLPAIDESGLAFGLFNAGMEFYRQSFENLAQKRGRYAWGLFFPNGGILKSVSEFIDRGSIKPVISSVVRFEDAKEAFRMLQSGTTKGKIVLDMCDKPK